MSGINILLAAVGSGVTLVVAVGMVLITPGGTEAHVQTDLGQPRSQPEPDPDRDPGSPHR
jgi:hypothetical protein